jgi:hypothetical protein
VNPALKLLPYYQIRLMLQPNTSVKFCRGMLTLARKCHSQQDAEDLATSLHRARALVLQALPCTPLVEVELAIFSMASVTQNKPRFWRNRSV